MDDPHWIVLDACVCINITAALGGSLVQLEGSRPVIVPQVATEAMCLHDENDGEPVRTPIALDGLEIAALSQAEIGHYVRFAENLDDGEAASLAVALGRGWTFATDDKAAIRTAMATEPPVPFTTTGTLLRRHAEATAWDRSRITEAVRAVRDRAAFVAPRSDPEFDWWTLHL